jgi:hypothetical protein
MAAAPFVMTTLYIRYTLLSTTLECAMTEVVANRKTGRERWLVVVWDDPAVIEEIKRRADDAREDVGPEVRAFLRAKYGLPPFPEGLAKGGGSGEP